MMHDRSDFMLELVKAALIALIGFILISALLSVDSDVPCEDEHGCDYYSCKAEHAWTIFDENTWLQKEENCLLRRNE